MSSPVQRKAEAVTVGVTVYLGKTISKARMGHPPTATQMAPDRCLVAVLSRPCSSALDLKLGSLVWKAIPGPYSVQEGLPASPARPGSMLHV